MSDKSISDLQRENAQLRKEIEQLRAQPARQVGGDEREQFEGNVQSRSLERYPNGRYVDPFVSGAWFGWQVRAALAPAAEDSVLNACITYVIHGSADFSGMHDGLVAYFKEKVDSLNRRAILVELLERIAKHLEWDGDPEKTAYTYAQQSDALAVELRALLGNVE